VRLAEVTVEYCLEIITSGAT